MQSTIIALFFIWSTLLCQQASVVAFAFQSISTILPVSVYKTARTIQRTSRVIVSKENKVPCHGFLCPSLKMSGRGDARDYSWTEEAFELEVTVLVPKKTRAKDILFKANSTSVQLLLANDDDDTNIILLDPARKLRGKVIVDGTYWVISDPEFNTDDDDDDKKKKIDKRQVTVTIEKRIRRPKDDFDVVEYDWNGVYSEDQDEVTFREYDKAETLDVRDYAASLGVDIDNINMSMVDKTMFTSGLNTTQSTLEELTKAGYVQEQEVTQQGDGSEWVTGEDGEQVPFSSLGNAISPDEMKTQSGSKIPFLDTNSPWNKAIPVDKREEAIANATKAAVERHQSAWSKAIPVDKREEFIANATKAAMEELGGLGGEREKTATTTIQTDSEKMKELVKQRKLNSKDPIEALTVARLKEVLKSNGLKVTGNKKELQDRLRVHVNSMMRKQNDGDDDKGNDE